MANFDDAFSSLVKSYGNDFYQDTFDEYNSSKFGITLSKYRIYINPNGSIYDLMNFTEENAKNFYKKYLWDSYRYDSIFNTKLVSKIFCAGVDIGIYESHRRVQRACNLIDKNQVLDEDGALENITINVVNKQNCEHMIKSYCEQLALYYVSLVEIYPGQRGKLRGWLNRVFEHEIPKDFDKFL